MTSQPHSLANSKSLFNAANCPMRATRQPSLGAKSVSSGTSNKVYCVPNFAILLQKNRVDLDSASNISSKSKKFLDYYDRVSGQTLLNRLIKSVEYAS